MALDKKKHHTQAMFITLDFKFLGSKMGPGTSLVVQWLRLRASNAGCVGSVPGWGTKIPHAKQHG